MAKDFSKLSDEQKKVWDRLINDMDFYQSKLDAAGNRRNELVMEVERYQKYVDDNKVSRLNPLPAAFGLGDEIAAAAGATADNIKNFFDPTRENRIGKKTYSDFLADARNEEAKFREAYPVQAIGTELLGGVLTGLGVAPFLTKGASKVGLGKLTEESASTAGDLFKRYALPGAIGGGIYGFNTGEGGALNRVKNMPLDAAIGGGAGAGLGAVAKTGGAIIDTLNPTFSQSRILNQAADKAGGADAVVDRLRNDGLTLVEQGDGSASRFARSAIESDARATENVRSFINQSADEKQEDLFNFVFKDIESEDLQIPQNADEDVFAYSSRVIDENAANKKAFYESALKNNDGTDKLVKSKTLTKFFEFANRDSFKALPDKAKENLSNYVDANGDKIFTISKNGRLLINKENLTFDDLDNLSRSLRIQLDPADMKYFNTVKAMKNLSDDLLEILDESSPNLKNARIAAARTARIQDIFKTADSKFRNTRPNEYKFWINETLKLADNEKIGLSKNEILQTIRRGILNKIDETMTVSETGEARFVRDLFNPKSGYSQIMKQVFPEDSYETFTKKLDILNESKTAKIRFNESSRTAEAIKGRDKLDIPIVGDIIDRFFNRYGLSASDKRKVADMLTTRSPEILEAALRDQRYIGALSRAIQPLVVSVASQDPENKISQTLDLL